MATSHPVCVPFSPTIETVAEFVERFQVRCREVLHKTRNDPLRQASVLIQALPVQVVTDLQRLIKPVFLSEISYDVLLEKYLLNLLSRSLKLVLRSSFFLVSRVQINQLKIMPKPSTI